MAVSQMEMKTMHYARLNPSERKVYIDCSTQKMGVNFWK